MNDTKHKRPFLLDLIGLYIAAKALVDEVKKRHGEPMNFECEHMKLLADMVERVGDVLGDTKICQCGGSCGCNNKSNSQL